MRDACVRQVGRLRLRDCELIRQNDREPAWIDRIMSTAGHSNEIYSVICWFFSLRPSIWHLNHSSSSTVNRNLLQRRMNKRPRPSLSALRSLISMMAHVEDVSISASNERVGMSRCQLQRKNFALQRPRCQDNETVVWAVWGGCCRCSGLIKMRGEISGQWRDAPHALFDCPGLARLLCWHQLHSAAKEAPVWV